MTDLELYIKAWEITMINPPKDNIGTLGNDVIAQLAGVIYQCLLTIRDKGK